MTAPGAGWPVTNLDDKGDGIADTAEGPRAIALALPGDRVIRQDAGLVLIPASDSRVRPPCAVFEQCGGCRMLHCNESLYETWKVGRIERAFAAKGLAPPLAPLIRSPLASRRRLTFTAMRQGAASLVGYHGRASHQVVDVADCPALAPALNAALPALRDLAHRAAATTGEARLLATLCDNGIDAALDIRAAKTGRARQRPKTSAAPIGNRGRFCGDQAGAFCRTRSARAGTPPAPVRRSPR